MNRSLQTLAGAYLLASVPAVLVPQQVSSPALALEDTPKLAFQTQSLQELFESEFAILRLQGNQARVAGVGFVIHQAPTRILTCYHVVSEGTELNDGPVSFGIARRTEEANETDTRRVTWGWIKAKHLQFKPEYDMAILEVEPQANPQVAEKLHLTRSRPLHLNLDKSRRAIGSPVTWLTTAFQGDLKLTPRLFTGAIVANYIADEKYSYQTSAGSKTEQVIAGARMLEVDKLFIPGASGSPILNAQTMEVIGYVHGYRTFALSSNVEVVEDVEIGEQSELKKQKLKYRLPLVTSLSLGIDLRTAERFLVDEGYVAK